MKVESLSVTLRDALAAGGCNVKGCSVVRPVDTVVEIDLGCASVRLCPSHLTELEGHIRLLDEAVARGLKRGRRG
jgi:hypothetical protein